MTALWVSGGLVLGGRVGWLAIHRMFPVQNSFVICMAKHPEWVLANHHVAGFHRLGLGLEHQANGKRAGRATGGKWSHNLIVGQAFSDSLNIHGANRRLAANKFLGLHRAGLPGVQ